MTLQVCCSHAIARWSLLGWCPQYYSCAICSPRSLGQCSRESECLQRPLVLWPGSDDTYHLLIAFSQKLFMWSSPIAREGSTTSPFVTGRRHPDEVKHQTPLTEFISFYSTLYVVLLVTQISIHSILGLAGSNTVPGRSSMVAYSCPAFYHFTLNTVGQS